MEEEPEKREFPWKRLVVILIILAIIPSIIGVYLLIGVVVATVLFILDILKGGLHKASKYGYGHIFSYVIVPLFHVLLWPFSLGARIHSWNKERKK